MGKSKTPAPPPLSAEEQDLYQKQGAGLDIANQYLQSGGKTLGQMQNISQLLSGLYNPDGSVNDAAVNSLAQRMAQQQAASEQATALEQGRYLQALKGERPISEAQKQAEAQQFNQLKEQAGRRGIRIEGNDIFTATSNSTAGNQLLSEMRKNATLTRQSEMENAIAQGNAFSKNYYTPGESSLGLMQNAAAYSPANLSSSYLGLSQAYGNAAQPYADQRMLQYQYELSKQKGDPISGAISGGVGGAGTGAMIGGPWGALIGGVAGAGLGAYGASRGGGTNQAIGQGMGLLSSYGAYRNANAPTYGYSNYAPYQTSSVRRGQGTVLS